MTSKKRTLNAVLLAAGKGTRMLSEAVPKVLQAICGEPMLSYTLETTRSLNPSHVVGVIGFGREQVKSTFSSEDIIWAVQEEQLGTAHATQIGIDALPDKTGDTIILNGDLPHLTHETLKGIIELHRESGADGTILTCRKTDPTGYGRIIRNDQNRPINIVEEKDAAPQIKVINEINAGVYVYKTKVLDKLLKKIEPKNKQHEYYLTDAFVILMKNGGHGETYLLRDEQEIQQITNRSDLARASKRVFLETTEKHMSQGVTIVSPETTFIDKSVVIGQDTVILPFCVIKKNVRIGKQCEVGPFTHLREGSVLQDGAEVGNFTELKNTVLGSHSKAKHLSYLGDGIVGERVNIGAGTILANYDGKAKHKTHIEDNAFIGSGSILIAPLTVGQGAVTGAGAVVPKHHDVQAESVVLGVPARPMQGDKTPHPEKQKKCPIEED